MTSATIWPVVHGEISSAAITLVLLAMASLVAYMRWRVAPIRAAERVLDVVIGVVCGMDHRHE